MAHVVQKFLTECIIKLNLFGIAIVVALIVFLKMKSAAGMSAMSGFNFALSDKIPASILIVMIIISVWGMLHWIKCFRLFVLRCGEKRMFGLLPAIYLLLLPVGHALFAMQALEFFF